MQVEQPSIRRARPEDDRAIYEAHMRSIREVCARDYSPEQIEAWGGRAFIPGFWPQIMARDPVWVVDAGGALLGFAHVTKLDAERAELSSLFLVPEALGLGLGRMLLEEALAWARAQGVSRVVLSATKTALSFYLAQGFQRVPGCTERHISGVAIDCLPMERPLL
jgi:putative acetyltransferase